MNLHLLDLIYEAATNPERWEDVLDQMSRIAGGEAGALAVLRPGEIPIRMATSNYGGDLLHDFMRTDLPDGRMGPNRTLVRQLLTLSTEAELHTPGELENGPVYTLGLRVGGTAWTAVTSLPTGDTMILDLTRSSSLGPFTPHAMEALDLYRPHLERAAVMASRLKLSEARAATNALAQLGLPAATLTSGGKVLTSNELFEAIESRLNLGTIDKSKAAGSSFRRTFARGLAAKPGSVRSIPVPATMDDPALVLHVLSMNRGRKDIFASVAFLLVATPVTMPEAPLIEVLTGLFDLTPAEARIAAGVARGQKVQHLAADFGVSMETVRTQLKSVLNKTGTSRQTDLALLLSGTRL